MMVFGPSPENRPDSRWRAIADLFPSGVSGAFADAGESPPQLFPEEEVAISRAVPSRQREFAMGRWCARLALAELGVAPGPIPVRADRGPAWPRGWVGSITHCAGFVGAVVASSDQVTGIGFDVEPSLPLDANLIHLICRPEEITWADQAPPPPAANWEKVFFCAKEAIHKCVAPLSGVMLDFRDVGISFEAARDRFIPTLKAGPGEKLPDFADIIGRHRVTAEYIFASAVIEARIPRR